MPVGLIRSQDAIGEIRMVRTVRIELGFETESGVTAILRMSFSIFSIKEVPSIELDRRLRRLHGKGSSADRFHHLGELPEPSMPVGQNQTMVITTARNFSDVTPNGFR